MEVGLISIRLDFHYPLSVINSGVFYWPGHLFIHWLLYFIAELFKTSIQLAVRFFLSLNPFIVICFACNKFLLLSWFELHISKQTQDIFMTIPLLMFHKPLKTCSNKLKLFKISGRNTCFWKTCIAYIYIIYMCIHICLDL